MQILFSLIWKTARHPSDSLVVNNAGKKKLKWSQKDVALSKLKFITHGKIKKNPINLFKNNKFKYSRLTPEKKFELSEESYPILCRFLMPNIILSVLLKNNGLMNNPSIHIYIVEIKNRIIVKK